jgi:hypothetical protein
MKTMLIFIPTALRRRPTPRTVKREPAPLPRMRWY